MLLADKRDLRRMYGEHLATDKITLFEVIYVKMNLYVVKGVIYVCCSYQIVCLNRYILKVLDKYT
jgi:hypothetical protein